MESIKMPFRKKGVNLALGAESAGIFAVYKDGNIFISENFGDLLGEGNFLKYKKAILVYLKKERIKPDVVLSDMHPLYKTTVLGGELSVKFKVKHIKIQHHIAHIFSSLGDKIMHDTRYMIPDSFMGIAMDGTGYGLDEKIWGGEALKIKSQFSNPKIQVLRIGSLEEQTMIGGDLAIREPARMLIAILAKIPNPKLQIPSSKIKKDHIYKFVKKFYSRNEFELLYNQLEQNFNCEITTSTGRILDAVSVLLGFAGNERNYKHEAAKKLEQNSGIPYNDLAIKITDQGSRQVLDTTHLFEYLIRNYDRDKKRLAATAQLYLAKGLYGIAEEYGSKTDIFAAGGMANNKIISAFLEYHRVYMAKKIPRGDEGVAVGQIVYYILSNDR